MIAMAEGREMCSCRKIAARRAQRAPEVFYMGSEMDSSMKRIPKYESVMERI